MNEFTALDSIQAPGTAVFGYRRGDAVSADVVENWNLEVGTDVVEGDLPAEQDGPAPLQRPGLEGTHADWEAWAVANGMSEQDAAGATLEELQAVESEPPAADGPVSDPDRPVDSARKADWVAYVESRGADPAWAGADSTTKADLQAWAPESGDPVAEAATEANS